MAMAVAVAVATEAPWNRFQVLGYLSYQLQGGGRLALQQALRIRRDLVGKGVGRRFVHLCRERLAEEDPEVQKKKICPAHPEIIGFTISR